MAAGAAPSPVQQYYRKAGLPDHALAATIRLAETSVCLDILIYHMTDLSIVYTR